MALPTLGKTAEQYRKQRLEDLRSQEKHKEEAIKAGNEMRQQMPWSTRHTKRSK